MNWSKNSIKTLERKGTSCIRDKMNKSWKGIFDFIGCGGVPLREVWFAMEPEKQNLVKSLLRHKLNRTKANEFESNQLRAVFDTMTEPEKEFTYYILGNEEVNADNLRMWSSLAEALTS